MGYYLERGAGRIVVDVNVPGDKSVSHRALMLAAVAKGESRIDGLLMGEDVMSTAAALRTLGTDIALEDNGQCVVRGVGGAEYFRAPKKPLDFGNAGTASRLMMGLLAPCDFETEFTGDASLRKRPMRRVTDPLSRMGASFRYLKEDGKLPLVMKGGAVTSIDFVMDTPSAQVKSAILLAGLRSSVGTIVVEPTETRDHTEKMLKAFGASVVIDKDAQGRRRINLSPSVLTAVDVAVPADPSSAAFPALFALLGEEGSAVTLPNLCVNPHRIGFYGAVEAMGGGVEYRNRRQSGGEDIADVVVRKNAPLRAIATRPQDAPSMIDEFPALAMLAAVAEGESRLQGLEELRAKESDRFSAIVEGLSACGVPARGEGNDIVIQGTGGDKPKGGANISVNLDHRIAMAYIIFGTACHAPVTVDDVSAVATSFPDFLRTMAKMGANLQSVAK
ncbi:MAG: 3-phosphoshikimate 1-carboxyvinyltransferase [Rickettsiales bacterium]